MAMFTTSEEHENYVKNHALKCPNCQNNWLVMHEIGRYDGSKMVSVGGVPSKIEDPTSFHFFECVFCHHKFIQNYAQGYNKNNMKLYELFIKEHKEYVKKEKQKEVLHADERIFGESI